MTSLIVEIDTNTQLESLKQFISGLGARFKVLPKEDEINYLSTDDEMKIYSQALRNHSSKSLADFVANENESMF